jgi:hypothetical protein
MLPSLKSGVPKILNLHSRSSSVAWMRKIKSTPREAIRSVNYQRISRQRRWQNALLEFAYEFRTAAKHLERDERELMVRAASLRQGARIVHESGQQE